MCVAIGPISPSSVPMSNCSDPEEPPPPPRNQPLSSLVPSSTPQSDPSFPAKLNTFMPMNEDEGEGEPITVEGEMPQKRFYRSRAHCNPLSFNDSFEFPDRPESYDWTVSHYPKHPSLSKTPNGQTEDKVHSHIHPTVLDIGCGFGGLTVALGTLLPDETILGMEIRAKVCEYVRLRILAERKQSNDATHNNTSVMRTNSMKFLPHWIRKGSLEKMFFCFPDPHFKVKNHKKRIVSSGLLSEYAYFLKPGGLIYCITDVKELHEWHDSKLARHRHFVKRSDAENEGDPCVAKMKVETEEGKKVARGESCTGESEKYFCVYRKLSPEEIAPVSFAEEISKDLEEREVAEKEKEERIKANSIKQPKQKKQKN